MGVQNYNGLVTLNPQAVITKYSNDLRRQAILRDIYTNVRGEDIIYQGQRLSIPNGIYTKMKASDVSGANNVRVILKIPVNANILTANTVALGAEVAPVIRSGTLYRNNYRFVVQAPPGYGEHRLDAQPYGLYEEHVRDLAPHAAAEEGLEIRMALVETYGWNLRFGSTIAVCPQQFNRNFFVSGLSVNQQPVFHPTWQTYTNRICQAIDLAAGGDGLGSSNWQQRVTEMLNGNTLDSLMRWALRRRMTPLTIDGRSAFVLTISQLQAQRFSDPSVADSMGARWTAQNNLTEHIQNWYGVIGKYVSATGADIYCVVDERLPTLWPTGSALPFGLAAGYVWPTDNDLRNLAQDNVRDACILHGKGALVNLEPERMHMIHQDWDYDVRNGAGYAGNRGIQQLQFDTSPADATGASRLYFGSAVVVCSRAEP